MLHILNFSEILQLLKICPVKLKIWGTPVAPSLVLFPWGWVWSDNIAWAWWGRLRCSNTELPTVFVWKIYSFFYGCLKWVRVLSLFEIRVSLPIFSVDWYFDCELQMLTVGIFLRNTCMKLFSVLCASQFALWNVIRVELH